MAGTRTTFIASVTVLCVATAATNVSAEPACHAIAVVAAPDLDDAWTGAASDLRAQLPQASATDCVAMTLSISPSAGNSARLKVTSKDGREAERLVDKPSALGATALGLVASLPPDEAAHTEPAIPHATGSAAPSIPVASAQPSVDRFAPPPTAPPASLQVWLGGGLGGRIAEPSKVGMLDLEAHGDFEVRHWFLEVSLRYGSSIGETLVAHDASYEETVIGLGIGRSIPLGTTNVQIVLMPSIAAITVEDADNPNGSAGSRSEVRAGAAIRWSLRLDNWWRFTIGVDSDFSPRSLTHYVYVDSSLPPLPFWTGGLRLGVTGKLL